MTTFDEVRPVADAVLYEGYVLYPYRADDPKNRVRWQFGVLVPPAVAASDPSERAELQADLLVEGRAPTVEVRVGFLQVQRRTVQRDTATSLHGAGPMEPVPQLRSGDVTYLPFDEADARDLDLRARVRDLLAAPYRAPFAVPGGVEVQVVPGGRLTRERLPLDVSVTLSARALPGPYGVTRLRVQVRNTTGGQVAGPLPRQEALRHSLVAAHLLIRLAGGRFLSLTDPPEWAQGYVRECRNDGVWPVLAGEPGSRDMVLCSPIILGDHPRIAPESSTAFFDATEMDEMLTLRTLTLTDEEKRAARGTDPRTADLLDRVEGLPPEVMDRLHGAIRYLGATARHVGAAPEDPAPADDDVLVGGVPVRAGSRVLLRPGRRRSDAQDIFLAGRTATVARVLHDLDGGDHLAVLLDDDEGRDIALVHGRFLYFAPDEVEPLVAPSRVAP